ncbi:MAG: Lpg1974 family pore-forming outer membrane protein [Planctomycetota bacterium]|nr:Lpg1974 family pore-forming outer membrane protein [Planctomycetota bacterium]
MNTRFLFSLAAAAAICFGGQTVNAQYPQQYPGQFAPGYGYQNPGGMMPMGQPVMMPGMMPSSPLAPAAFAQPSPFGAPAAFIPASPAMAPPSQVMPVGFQADCGGKGCGGCDNCSKGGKGSGAGHTWEFYGEFLYLRARDSEVAYAVPFNGPVVPPNTPRVEVGPVGVLDMDFQPSFRVGINRIIDDYTQLSVEYTMYESGTTSQTLRGSNPMWVVHSLVSHPSTGSAGNSYDQADGQYDISMDIFDVEMRRLFYNDCDLKIGWVLGVRAAQQEQQMQVDFTGNGTETVTTDIDFTGVGVKFGLDGEASLGNQWLAYANFSGSLMPGVFNADFDQSRNLVSEVDTGWEAGRIVTIWDLELGVSRISRCGNYRWNAGYMFSAWTNTLQTDEWIDAVHTNNFIGMDSTMTFDGLVARFEARY